MARFLSFFFSLLSFSFGPGALGVVLLLASPSTAHADAGLAPTAPHPFAYGILVGTNVGGAGQQPLRYAEDDARRMADVLRQLGRYGNADLRVLVRPDAAQLLATVDDGATKMRVHQARGEQAVLVFYYSGHARASSFSLGVEELAIASLREKLRQIPSTLTLVVLDACQSGQFARTKGAEPAADFSFNSVQRLTTKGIAVMASSSAQELSQESDELKSSYFTHHLVVGLRGAADADGDGRVSLDEAYRYAYRRTLVATSETQVGGQHVTLETDLAGQGEVPVTYPADARSQLELPAALEARVLVQHKPSGNVVAEVQKVKGPPLRLAFAAGTYEAVVRDAAPPSRVLRCSLVLVDQRLTTLDLGACQAVRAVATAKGDAGEIVLGPPAHDADPDVGHSAPPAALDPWSVEVGAGFSGRVEDGYTRRLEEFGYERERGLFELPRGRLSLAVSRGFFPHLALGVSATTLSGDSYARNVGDSNDSFTFSSYGVTAFLRAATALFGVRDHRHVHLDVYGQFGIGLGLGFSTLETGSSQNGERTTASETEAGLVVSGAGGLALAFRGGSALFFQGGWDHAPTLRNLVGDTHDSGGGSFQLGLRIAFAR